MKSGKWKERLAHQTKCDGQKEVAKRLKTSQATISEWLSGKYKPSSKKVGLLAVELGMEVSDLIKELNE